MHDGAGVFQKQCLYLLYTCICEFYVFPHVIMTILRSFIFHTNCICVSVRRQAIISVSSVSALLKAKHDSLNPVNC